MKHPLIVVPAVVAALAVAALTLGEGGDEMRATTPAAASEPATGPAAGEIRFLRNASSAFDRYLLDPTAENRAFIVSHYWRLRGYPPTSDGAIEWAPPIQFYRDLYALYPGDSRDRRLLRRHPDWVLRDSDGDRLYVPFDCAEGTCAAYAADPGSGAFRAYWIRRARRELAKGYVGIFVDNVNMVMRVGNGFGNEIAPIDPRTGRRMRLARWQHYVAGFVERIRRALPGAEITHNVIWFADRSNAVRRAIEAADYVELERGFADPGLLEDDGSAYRSFLDYVEWVHSLGRSVMLEPYELDEQRRLFELANYFLVNDGADAIASDFEADPDNWWPGWETSLGAPLGPRREIDGGVLRREFASGLVLVNPPGSEERRISLGNTYTDLEGAAAETVTLGPAQGAVLLEPE